MSARTFDSRIDKLLSHCEYVRRRARGEYMLQRLAGNVKLSRLCAERASLKHTPTTWERQSDVEHRYLMSFRALLDGLFIGCHFFVTESAHLFYPFAGDLSILKVSFLDTLQTRADNACERIGIFMHTD